MNKNLEQRVEVKYIKNTQNWLQAFVIGMNFCPFAKVPFDQDRIQYLIEESNDWKQMAMTVGSAMKSLVETPAEEVETTLIILPNALPDFTKYLDFIDVVQDFLEEEGLEGVLQIASFHPQYQFANTTPHDAENYTNRSPYPMIHLLREKSVSRAVDHYPNVYDIPEKNIARLEQIGEEAIKNKWNEIIRSN
ncbi:MAG: DUF1415 domain-containing protein [Bacteroidota bacterium]